METSVPASENLGSIIEVLFSASNGFEIFGLSLTYWIAIIIILSAVAMIIKGAKS